MIVTDRLRSAGEPAPNQSKKLYDLFEIILGEYNELKSGNHLFRGKLIDLETRRYLQQFKGWNMPQERAGYIKPKKHDFL